MLALCEKEGRVGVTGLEISGVLRDGVIGRDILGKVITRGIFEVVPALEEVLVETGTCECEIGLRILDDCDLLGVLGCCCAPAESAKCRNNKTFFSISFE